MEEVKRICNQCLKEKDISEFYKQEKINKNGSKYIYYNPKCKECCIKNSWERIKNNWEQYKESHLEDYHSGRWSYAQEQNSSNRRINGKYSKWQKSDTGKQKSKVYAQKRFNKIHEISMKEWEECKAYFGYECAYCGLPLEEHYKKRNNTFIKCDFHREHVDNNGSNLLDNCIPSCINCNTSKNKKSFSDWYNPNNSHYSVERFDKIIAWLFEDYKKYKED